MIISDLIFADFNVNYRFTKGISFVLHFSEFLFILLGLFKKFISKGGHDLLPKAFYSAFDTLYFLM
jgi:hypothetical protein